ncbi:MAG: ATP-binding protein [Oscillibacter sp.]|nr:ATP-binding protein [Oscillibacter sp.]
MAQARKIKMQTDYKGLIHILADRLYTTSDVFVRELIQNASDGVVRRQAKEGDGYQGEIHIHTDAESKTVSFTDDGIGMDETDILNDLSKIGASGTGEQREQLEERFSRKLIGQFGIGLLSAFRVAYRVEVRTKKAESGEAYLWANTGDIDCELVRGIEWGRIGSTVTVFLRPEYEYMLDAGKLEEIVVRYCDLLPVPIYINDYGPVNYRFPPWEQERSPLWRQEYRDFVSHRYHEITLDVFPLRIDTKAANGAPCQAGGLLYIPDENLDSQASGAVDVFVRRMLVKERDTGLLPNWARFFRGALDCPGLRPNAGRDNIDQEDPVYRALKQALAVKIMERLYKLAEQPDGFAAVSRKHGVFIKSIAAQYPEFFQRAAPLLSFRTNAEGGASTLREYLTRSKTPGKKTPIRYFTAKDADAVFERANQKGLRVIDAGGRFDEELLKRYAEEHSSEVVLEKLDGQGQDILFQPVPERDRSRFLTLERALQTNLATYGVTEVRTRVFAPRELPATLTDTEETERDLERRLESPAIREKFGGVFDDLTDRKPRKRKGQRLTLNAKNPLIRLLAEKGTSVPPADWGKLLYDLYASALLHVRRLDEKSAEGVHEGFSALMERALELLDENAVLQNRLNQKSDELVKVQTRLRKGNAPEHIRLFLIIKYNDAGYDRVRDALRLVFEQAPFWFEVRVAGEFFDTQKLVENVRTQMDSAHGFLAEISEQFPNVMMEAGAVLVSGDERPLFAFRDEGSPAPPVDFGDHLTYQYGSREQSAEEIAKRIYGQVVKDGDITDGKLSELCAARKKKYLSRTLLEHLQYVKLADKASGHDYIETILRKYQTVEDFLTVSKDELAALCKAPDYVFDTAQKEVDAQVKAWAQRTEGEYDG